mgnify:CR=1 FL=1
MLYELSNIGSYLIHAIIGNQKKVISGSCGKSYQCIARYEIIIIIYIAINNIWVRVRNMASVPHGGGTLIFLC